MNSSDTRWVQGAVVLYLDPDVNVSAKDLIRDTDYVLLQMMGKIKHRADGFPPIGPRYFGWPFQR
jgi:hypothetical protein